MVSLLQRNLLLLRCVRFQTFRSSSDILLPLLRAALSGLSVLVCSVLSTLPPTLLPSLRTGPLHRATAASSSTKRILEGWVPGISEYGHPHRITWVGTVTLVTTTTRNKRLQHRQLCASGFLFFLLRGLHWLGRLLGKGSNCLSELVGKGMSDNQKPIHSGVLTQSRDSAVGVWFQSL